jgi:hypothetical protein
MIVEVYSSDPRLTNDCKSSHRVGKARKWLKNVENAGKFFEKVCPWFASVGICAQSQQ